MDRKGMFAELRRRMVGKVVVEFSGGGDEGGVEEIRLLSATGFPMGTIKPWDGKGIDKELAEILSAPVYDRYYGFAGEFHVSGTIEYNVETETATMECSESHEEYENFEESV